MESVNPETIAQQIDDVVINFFTVRNIDIYDTEQCKKVPHNLLTLCMMSIYDQLFKPDKKLWQNKKSLIDYKNPVLISVIADAFVKWSLWFNKSLGLMQFSIMTGIHRCTLAEWRDNKELNPELSDIIQNICECHKMEQINILNESPVGALAVANNDNETGLNWSRQQALEQANNAVFLIPSERVSRLNLEKVDS